MMFKFLTNRLRPKEFNYIPMHYSEEDERKAELEAMARNESDTESMKKRIEHGFRSKGKSFGTISTRRYNQMRSLRLVGIVIGLICLSLVYLARNFEKILSWTN